MSEIGKMWNIQWKTLTNKNIAMLNRESLVEKMKTSYKKLDANELKLETQTQTLYDKNASNPS